MQSGCSALMRAQTHAWLAQPGRCCHFALEIKLRIFFPMKTRNPAEVPVLWDPLQKHSAGLAIPGMGDKHRPPDPLALHLSFQWHIKCYLQLLPQPLQAFHSRVSSLDTKGKTLLFKALVWPAVVWVISAHINMCLVCRQWSWAPLCCAGLGAQCL